MNYRQKKNFFQNFNFTYLQKTSKFTIFLQAKTLNSLNRTFLIKELNKLNFKLQIYQTKLLRQQKFIFDNRFSKSVYSGLFLVLSTNSSDYFKNIHLCFNFIKDFIFLLPICIVFLKNVCFITNLQKLIQFTAAGSLPRFILLIHLYSFINVLKFKSML